MKHSLVDALNRWIGEETGLLINGKPRFCWQWAPDMVYWRTRLPAVWVMTYWGLPVWSEKQWSEAFGSLIPYPRNGMYHAYPESQLHIGSVPTYHLTANYIRMFQQQMSTSAWHKETECRNGADEVAVQHLNQFRQQVQDDAPAFQNFTPGSRGSHVSFGGV